MKVRILIMGGSIEDCDESAGTGQRSTDLSEVGEYCRRHNLAERLGFETQGLVGVICRKDSNLHTNDDRESLLREILSAIGDGVHGVIVPHGRGTIFQTMDFLLEKLKAQKAQLRFPAILVSSECPINAPGSDGPLALGSGFAHMKYLPGGVYALHAGALIAGEVNPSR